MPCSRSAAALSSSALLALACSAAACRGPGAGHRWCSIARVQEEWCRPMVTAFERETGIKVAMTRKSSGEIYAQVKAEAAQSARRHLVGRHRRSASAGGRGRPDRSSTSRRRWRSCRTGRCSQGSSRRPHGRRLRRRARLRLQHRAAEEEEAAPSRSAGPTCSSREYKDEVQVADPNSSGTSYTMLATLVQLMGEDKALRVS